MDSTFLRGHDDEIISGTSDAGSADEPCDMPLIEQLLPGHKIARGRGRRKQLAQMSEQEKAAEAEARMLKLRISARECRKRKKVGIQGIKAKIHKFVRKEQQNLATIDRLQGEMKVLHETLAAIRNTLAAEYNFSRTVPQQVAACPQKLGAYPAVTPIDTMADTQPLHRMKCKTKTTFDCGPYESYTSVLKDATTSLSLHEKRRYGTAPSQLSFDGEETETCATPTPPVPLLWSITPSFKLQGVDLQLISGWALPTPERSDFDTVAFDFDCLDAEVPFIL
jgi:hypothetical protein